MFRPILIVLIILISLQSHAVHLSKDGTGQVLIFPYYTVNGGIDTLINLVNTTDEAKALRVRFREAANSREVFTFNLYLGPNDVWTGAVIKSGEPAVAKIISNDQSCTYPTINTNTQQFNNLNYTGDFSDSYPEVDNRMFEGFVEVFEMGVITGDSAEATTIDDETDLDCSAINGAWGTDGYWSMNAETDMQPPTGGITGNITLIHVGEGFAISQEPTVLKNFTDAMLHNDIGNESPSLADSTLSADIEYNGTYANITLPTGIEAVSALLMKQTLSNEYALNPDIAAKTDWIMTLPTRQYHVDPEYSVSQTPVAPFTSNGLACEPFSVSKMFDREEQMPLTPIGDIQTHPFPDTSIIIPNNCYATNNLNFLIGGNPALIPIGIFSSNHPTSGDESPGDKISQIGSQFESGWVELKFDQQSQINSNDEGFTLYGLPVIGFSAQKFTNANASPGLLAQYTGIFQHKYSTNLTRESTEFFNNGGLHIANDNKGQVLLSPYYTVRNGLNTIVSIVNTTGDVKALRIRFLEGKNSRDVLDFNIYLSAYDVWTAALIPTESTVPGYNGQPSTKLITFDNSCTVPIGINGQEFLPYAFTGDFSDELGSDLNRSQEGSIEIFEMGNLLGPDANAATHNSSGVPASCVTLQSNWTPPAGKWLQTPNDNVAAPDGTGGLYASVSIIDVAEGSDMNYDATALASFTIDSNHTAPGDLAPNLSTGIIDQTRIITDEGPVITRWDSSINAVTALFMQFEVYNDYVVEPGIHAQTDWVNFYPSKPFYTDPLFSGSETRLVPFTIEFPFSLPENRCEPLIFRSYNRDQQASLDDRIWPATPPPLPPPQHCWGVNTASINEPDSTNSILGSHLQMENWAEAFGYDSIYETDFNNGRMKTIYNQSSLTGFGPNGERHEIYGLPVMGFTVSKYINSNAAPGLLANYATLNVNKGKRKFFIQTQQ